HVDPVAYELFSVIEDGPEVVEAGTAAVIDVDVDRVTDGQHVLAEDVLLPGVAADVGGVELHHRVPRLVDDLHVAVLLGGGRGGQRGQGHDCAGGSDSEPRHDPGHLRPLPR